MCTCSIFVCRHKNNDMSTLLGHAHTYIPTDRQTDRQTHRHTYINQYKHIVIPIHGCVCVSYPPFGGGGGTRGGWIIYIYIHSYICSFPRNNSGKYSPTIPPSLQETSAQPVWLLQPRFPPSSTLPAPQSPLALHLWKENNASTIPFGGLFCKIPGSTTVVAILNPNHCCQVEYQNNVCLTFVHSSTPVAYPTPELDMSLTQPISSLKRCIILATPQGGEYIPSNHLSYPQLVWELSTPPANSSEKVLEKNSYTS